MSFEKRVLELADDVGLRSAYFAYGTMFVPYDTISTSMQELKNFMALYPETFPGKTRVTLGAEEVAVDFVS